MFRKIILSIILISITKIPCFAQSEQENTTQEADESVQQFEVQKNRCLSLSYRISNIHNRLVDLNFINPSIERSLQDSINHLDSELDDAKIQFEKIEAKDRLMKTSIKNAKANISYYKKNLKKCESLLQKKKKKYSR